ncbi:MAG TPA: AAA family ATPase [Chitinophagaceae bacterium]|nr:AAA family ATPase [Chitinophagaceae bacterium]
MKKIVAIGPESTGKSTLCSLLASHYNTSWCPEYARSYLLSHGIAYNYDDLLTIARGQVALEEAYIENAKQQSRALPVLLFVDTDMYVMKVWCEYVYHKCHQYILDQITTRQYDLYLLCNPDLPWEPDVLREYPDEPARIELYGIYKKLLLNQNTPFIEIKGNYTERLQTAVNAVDNLIAHS